MPSKLVLTRKGNFINRRYRFKVLIDGAKAGEIKNDGTEEYELNAGAHTLQCKIFWMSSPIETFNIEDNRNTYLRVSSGMRFIIPLYILLLVGAFLPFFLRRILKVPAPGYVLPLELTLMIPGIIYYILYLSVLRKRYLVIGEDKSNPFK